MPTFVEKLNAAAEQNQSLVCVGIDPDPALFPRAKADEPGSVEDVAAFCKAIVEATADFVCCFKPNVAFFEALGDEGMAALRATIAAVPPEIPVIVDAKRGDIGNTSAAYAKAVFEGLGADAMTVNPYGGKDAIEPFLEYRDKGVLIWCRSSNPSAVDFQDLEVNRPGERAKMPLWQAVARKALEWNRHGNVGIVMGATYSQQLKEARELCPDLPILVPGVGAQEGSLREAVVAGLDSRGGGVVISASRSVLYASRDSDYAFAARAAAARLRNDVNRYRDEHRTGVEAKYGP